LPPDSNTDNQMKHYRSVQSQATTRFSARKVYCSKCAKCGWLCTVSAAKCIDAGEFFII
jgi:hypothetical protein